VKQKALWLNQIKGLCICLVVIYHSVLTFYPQLNLFQHPWSQTLSKCWVYFNLYLAPFRMPVFFFISVYLIRRYIDEVPWKESIDKRIWSIVYVLALWGVLQWTGLSQLNAWLALTILCSLAISFSPLRQNSASPPPRADPCVGLG